MNINSIPEKIILSGVLRTREIRIDGRLLFPDASLKLRNHSPDGFSWGYSGSGPAQLALSVLLKFLPEAEALLHYQEFKSEVIASLPMADFEKEIELRKIIKKISPNHE